jgi:hypothetical protein
VMIGIASLILQSKYGLGICDKDNQGSNLYPICVILIIIDTAKALLFDQALRSKFGLNELKLNGWSKTVKFSVKNLLLTFLGINLFFMTLCSILVRKEHDCQLFLSNFLIFDMISSFTALLNMWRENS